MGNKIVSDLSKGIITTEHEQIVLECIFENLKYIKQAQNENANGDLWTGRMGDSLGKFLIDGEKLDEESISNFRGRKVFLHETPTFQSLWPINWLIGDRRGQIRYGQERLRVLDKQGDLSYLEKYPINMVGNPNYFKMKGYVFNERWSRHVHYVHLASKYLGDLFNSRQANVLDIGGGYGIFLGLLKEEFGNVRSGIVEFPEQLLLTHYYLSMSFPNARINTLQEIYETEIIDKDFVEKFDFLLIPIDCYRKIEKGAFDLVTNFNSLGEMSREWFETYLNADVFQSAEYFFTLNRFESRPTYDTDLNILDYKLHEFEKIHFQISPLFESNYGRKYIFFMKQKHFTSQCFEFIGKRMNNMQNE